MKVTFYGKLASVLGRELDLAIDAPCTVADLRSAIAGMFPDAASALGDGRVRAFLASSLVTDTHLLAASDAVEFLPPVSGG